MVADMTEDARDLLVTALEALGVPVCASREGCPHRAEYAVVAPCCTWRTLLCNDHRRDAYSRWQEQRQQFWCRYCSTLTESDFPWAYVESLTDAAAAT
jgi:hypothetical protein